MQNPLITHVRTENWLGLPALSTPLSAFTLFCGPNAAGKTSLLEAIHFGIFGTLPRSIERKADLEHALSRGASSGTVTIQIDGRDVTRNVKTGIIGKIAVPGLPQLAEWVLTPATFSIKTEAERRKVLSELLGVKATPDSIAELLTKAGLPAGIVTELKGALLKGFAFAEKLATTRASEARGAWKQITGETHGTTKGADWKPAPTPDMPTPQAMDDAAEALKTVTAEINGLLMTIGAAGRNMDAATRDQLTAAAAKLPDWESALERGMVRDRELRQRISELTPKAQGNAGITCLCPHCEKPVILNGTTLQLPSETPHNEMLKADADLKQAKRELEEVGTKLTKCRESIASAKAAQVRLDAEPESIASDPAALKAELEQKQSRQASLSSLVNMHTSQKAAVAVLDGAAARALKEHNAILDYAKAAEKLSPNGIPSVLVGQTLGPVNELLAKASADASWPPVRLDADMVLWFGDTPYGLASESERWRMDAGMAYALASLCELPVLMLDRIDVLDLSERSNTLRWLHGLSRNGWQVLAAGTLKEAPKIPGIDAVWLDSQVSGRLAA